MTLKEKLRKFTTEKLGLHLFGVADLQPLREHLDEEIADTADNLQQVIVVGYRLSSAVLETLDDAPNQIYKTHYQQVNYILDRSTVKLGSQVESLGHKALPIPASHYIDKSCRKAHFSHRHAAVEAGLGWHGRNNLLVTPEYGAYVRLASVLTDTKMETGTPMENRCGDCYKCIEACPAGALSPKPPYYDFEKCFQQLNQFRGKHRIGHHICGLGIKPCKGERNS